MTRTLHVSLVNEDKGYVFSEWNEDLKDTWMGEDASIGDIFRACREEYGRCQSKIYVDTDKGPKAIGWYFVKRDQYQGDDDTYLRGAWVTVSES